MEWGGKGGTKVNAVLSRWRHVKEEIEDSL